MPVRVEFGFQYEGETYWIGNDTKLVYRGLNSYIFTIDAEEGEYPEDYGTLVVPEGSIFILRITAVYDKGFGRIFIRYGGDSLSQIVL